MFIVSHILIALARVLDTIFFLLYWLILIRALLSWVSPDPYNPIVQFFYKTTEPILYPIRKMIPFGLRFGIDISPIIAFLLILFLKSSLVNILLDWAIRLR